MITNLESLSSINSNADKFFITFSLCLKLFTTALISCFFATIFFFRKFVTNTGKQLENRKILITNGESKLSQELCRQLTKYNNCYVILVIDDNKNNNNNDNKNDSNNSSIDNSFKNENISIIKCNIKNYKEVKYLADYVIKNIGSIDILIDNGYIEKENNFTIGNDYIDCVSKNVLQFINLFVNFAPNMLQRKNGHIVTVRTNLTAAESFLNTRNEINQLIDQFELPYTTQRDSILLSTVLYENNGKPETNYVLNLSINEIAERIIKGIQSKKEIIEVSSKRNILKYLLIKITTTIKSAINISR